MFRPRAPVGAGRGSWLHPVTQLPPRPRAPQRRAASANGPFPPRRSSFLSPVSVFSLAHCQWDRLPLRSSVLVWEPSRAWACWFASCSFTELVCSFRPVACERRADARAVSRSVTCARLCPVWRPSCDPAPGGLTTRRLQKLLLRL